MFRYFKQFERQVWFSWLIIFVINACLMTVEIAAGRLLAPFIGVSIITWAGAIAIVMLAMALGYRLGGWISRDMRSSVPELSLLSITALSLFCTPWLANTIGPRIFGFTSSVSLASLCLSFVVLSIPAGLLAALYPVFLARTLSDRGRSGRVVGFLNAAAALGSIIGTFASGFIWLMWMPIDTIFFIMGGVLMGMAVVQKVYPFPFSQAPDPCSSEEGRSYKARLPLFYPSVAFVAGFLLMSLEVLASRALAPSLGVSVFSWTGIIGVVLLGIIVGNILGGLLADRGGSRVLLGRSLAGAGVAVLVTIYVVAVMGPLFSTISLYLPLKTFLFTLLAFFVPACALATISPQLARLAVGEGGKVGTTVASLSTWNTLGGLAGTLMTAFFLISWIGTRGLLVAIAGLLVSLGWWLSGRVFFWRRRLTMVMIVCFGLAVFLPSTCLRETRYFCIQLISDPSSTEANPSYILRLDHLVHSYVHLRRPEALGYGYEQVYAHLIAALKSPTDSFSSLFIGGGGYVLPRYLLSQYPQAQSVVAEIDPAVTRVNYDQLGLPPTPFIETASVDARLYVNYTSSSRPFDFVFGDAFNDFSVPYHLTTVEFHQALKRRMAVDGVYALNIIDDARYGQFVSAMIRTLQAVWTHVYVASGSADFEQGRNTIVLLATDRILDQEHWYTTLSPAASKTGMEPQEYVRLIQLLTQEKVDAFLKGHPVPLLTDAFAPTDRYLAPVFTDAY